MRKDSFSIHHAAKNVFETASCRVCESYRRPLPDGCFLCSRHGPVRSIDPCSSFCLSLEAKERHEAIINGRTCSECRFFLPSQADLLTGAHAATAFVEERAVLGVCVRYTSRVFDGQRRHACSAMQEILLE